MTDRQTLIGLFTLGETKTRKLKPTSILMKQVVMGQPWPQLDHMQIICTSPRAGTSSLNLNSVKDWTYTFEIEVWAFLLEASRLLQLSTYVL